MEPSAKLTLLAAYRRLLRPLVRILLRNGISFGQFSEVAKAVYVEVAARDFQVPNRKMSQARIAILTGLTRKEVNKTVAKIRSGDQEPVSNLNRVARVLSGWHTDPEFTGPYGVPLELKFEDDGNPDFSGLVNRYSGDMASRAMLDELLRVGAAIETNEGCYKVLTRTYLPQVDAPDSLERLARTVSNFTATVDFNRTESDPTKRRFERTVDADTGIRSVHLPELQVFIRERAQLLLEEIDNWLAKADCSDQKGNSDVIKTGVGIFHYIEEEEDYDEIL